MINTGSKNNSFMCVEDICADQIKSCQKCTAHVEQRVHPLGKYVHDLWISIRLFLGTDRWDHAVTLQRGDSHYTMKMEEIEARWRNR
jgi:hypothetical protein